jgi:hypothetical protein
MTNPFPITDQLSTIFDSAMAQVGESLETIRHNFYVMTKMLEAGDNTIAGIMINSSGRTEFSELGETKDEKRERDMRFLLLLNDIQQMELQLEAKYGENFAEQLAAEHLDEDTYNRIMEIEDQDERRREIAKALKEGIDNGTIDPAALDNDPQIREWIEARAQEREHKINSELSIEKDINSVESSTQQYESKADENRGNDLSTGLGRFLA